MRILSTTVISRMFAAILLALAFFPCGGCGRTPGTPITTAENCMACNGTGRNSGACAPCDGTGQRLSGLQSPIACTSCGGTGSVSMKCPACGGSGRQIVRPLYEFDIAHLPMPALR